MVIRGCLADALLLLSNFPAATPVEYRQKVAVYVWGNLGKDLETAAGDVQRLGAVRVDKGPAAFWDCSGKNDNSLLDVKARRAVYHTFPAAFSVVMLTTYDSASFDKYKHERLDAPHLAATLDEFRRFNLGAGQNARP